MGDKYNDAVIANTKSQEKHENNYTQPCTHMFMIHIWLGPSQDINFF